MESEYHPSPVHIGWCHLVESCRLGVADSIDPDRVEGTIVGEMLGREVAAVCSLLSLARCSTGPGQRKIQRRTHQRVLRARVHQVRRAEEFRRQKGCASKRALVALPRVMQLVGDR